MPELRPNNDERSRLVLDDSVDARDMKKSPLLDDLVPSSYLTNKIDVGNIERSNYENSIFNIVPEIQSVQMATDGENILRTELFLVSRAACLFNPSETLERKPSKPLRSQKLDIHYSIPKRSI